MITVLVTEPEYRKAEALFAGMETSASVRCMAAPSDEAALADAVRDREARYVIVGSIPYTDALYAALPRGGLIARFGVGHDNIDKGKASERGLLCTNTPNILNQTVAETTLALMLLLARRLASQVIDLDNGRWAPRIGYELSGKTLAIIGCGPIGRNVARTASAGFGMTVIGCDVRGGDEALLRRDYGFDRLSSDFADIVAAADIVSLHMAATRENRHFINRERLKLVPPTASVINTARGSMLCENDLYDALANGALAGAALDVFEVEPYKPQDPARDLRALPNCVMTPHIASSTQEACDRMAAAALRNVQLAESGNFEDMDLVNKDVLAECR